MQAQNMFIPSRIKVGFQTRGDTFTGKLAYVIYYDEKGVIRKEGSWKSWCDPKIPSIEFENKPQTGFILNKGVHRHGYWGSGRNVIRVYDPRDFEFEITVDNLMGILMHSDVSKRDIVESCVFAWYGGNLVLLPTNSEEYQQAVAYTAKQGEKISAKDFVLGYSYHAKKSDKPLTYVGYHEWWDWVDEKTGRVHKSKGKKHVFFDGKKYLPRTAADLSSVADSTVADNFSSVVDGFFGTIHSQPIVDIEVQESNFPEDESFYNPALHFINKDTKHIYQVSFYMYSSGSTFYGIYPSRYQFEQSMKVVDKDDSGTYGYSGGGSLGKQHKEIEQMIKACKDKVELAKRFWQEKNIGDLVYILKNGQKARHSREY